MSNYDFKNKTMPPAIEFTLINGKKCQECDRLGICHNKVHPGSLTRNLIVQHQCIEKACPWFEPFEEHPVYKRLYSLNENEIKENEKKYLQRIRDFYVYDKNFYPLSCKYDAERFNYRLTAIFLKTTDFAPYFNQIRALCDYDTFFINRFYGNENRLKEVIAAHGIEKLDKITKSEPIVEPVVEPAVLKPVHVPFFTRICNKIYDWFSELHRKFIERKDRKRMSETNKNKKEPWSVKDKSPFKADFGDRTMFLTVEKNSFCKESRICGFCHDERHQGYLTNTMVNNHNCIGKKCPYYEPISKQQPAKIKKSKSQIKSGQALARQLRKIDKKKIKNNENLFLKLLQEHTFSSNKIYVTDVRYNSQDNYEVRVIVFEGDVLAYQGQFRSICGVQNLVLFPVNADYERKCFLVRELDIPKAKKSPPPKKAVSDKKNKKEDTNSPAAAVPTQEQSPAPEAKVENKLFTYFKNLFNK